MSIDRYSGIFLVSGYFTFVLWMFRHRLNRQRRDDDLERRNLVASMTYKERQLYQTWIQSGVSDDMTFLEYKALVSDLAVAERQATLDERRKR